MPSTPGSGHQRSEISGYRLLRVVALIVVGFLLILYFTGTLGIFVSVKDIIYSDETSLRSVAGITRFCKELQKLAKQQYFQVLLFISTLYLFLQTFCIPGTLVLNCAIGAVMGTLLGVPFCTALGTAGAVSCYSLSRLFGNSLVEAVDLRLMKGKGLRRIRAQVARYRSDLLVYVLFLRLTPILPNWLVNMASPVVGVPLHTFSTATFLGIIPQTYLAVRFGSLVRVGKAGGQGRIVTPWDTLLLAVLGAGVLVAYRLKKKFAAEPLDASLHREQQLGNPV